MLEKDP